MDGMNCSADINEVGETNREVETQMEAKGINNKANQTDVPDKQGQQGDDRRKEFTLGDVMVAIEKVNSRLEAIERTDSVILSSLVKLVISNKVPDESGSAQEALVCDRENVTSRGSRDNTRDTTKSNMPNEKQSKHASGKDKNDYSVFIDDSGDDSFIKKRTGGLKRPFTREVRPLVDEGVNIETSDQDNNNNESEDDVMEVKPNFSDYRQRLSSKKTIRQANIPRPTTTAKKLSFTPTSTQRANKKQKTVALNNISAGKKQSPKTPSAKRPYAKGNDEGSTVHTSGLRPAGHLLPKNANCRFKPTLDMRLTDPQARVCAFVFDKDLDEGEGIFIVGNYTGTRTDFQCLCPGRQVQREVILYMALKVTWTQMNKPNKTVWCLPPAFAADVLTGSSVEDLHLFYGSQWMHQITKLNLIYVPIEEEGHWYLMVIALEEKKIYHLDSYLPNEKVQKRRYTIRDIAITLAGMIQIVYGGDIPLNQPADFTKWEIVEPRGIPNCGNSQRSGLWVLEWLRMEHLFCDNIKGVMNENKVRMDITMILMLGGHNEQKHVILAKASKHWLDLTRAENS